MLKFMIQEKDRNCCGPLHPPLQRFSSVLNCQICLALNQATTLIERTLGVAEVDRKIMFVPYWPTVVDAEVKICDRRS
ncbi:MAG: hypothetical protein PVH84_05150 [Candidatus Aminicenantes bacterium]